MDSQALMTKTVHLILWEDTTSEQKNSNVFMPLEMPAESSRSVQALLVPAHSCTEPSQTHCLLTNCRCEVVSVLINLYNVKVNIILVTPSFQPYYSTKIRFISKF